MAAKKKSFSELLKELNEFDTKPRQRLLVKSHVASGAKATQKPAISKQDLGLLLKSAINDAVASGRLSGTSAVTGLRALGLEE
ncbi:hypothetical protein G7047_05010 [Diaphorobacter sp. HDW4A]|uniref:hypothetical protein n=1 Tax=Diaphorobacter sp. HDW4A TaxID=2714924 RepID=UPI0014094795|nr:hypothetical protein [Diaphorobacter sp. HDW4A]QIL79336.1 hypothetical protein G7047_05010 [Diaphorobacter sp. HDW4A]